MKRIRGRVITLACWLVGFCGAEQLLEPMDFNGVAYLFILGMLMLVLATSLLARLPLWVLIIAPIPVFCAIKYWMGLLVGNTAVLLTIAEVCGIGVTTFLAYRLSLAISEFENAVAHITVGQSQRVTENVSLGAESLYREVRRARNHQRPLSLIAVAIEEKSLKVDLDRITQEAQQAMMKQYALSSVSRLLCEKLEDCDLIVKNNEHFLVLLPETKPEDLPGLIDRLRRQVSEQIGVELWIGVASLPHDGYTLEGLIGQATQGMKTDLASEVHFKLEQMFVNQHIY